MEKRGASHPHEGHTSWGKGKTKNVPISFSIKASLSLEEVKNERKENLPPATVIVVWSKRGKSKRKKKPWSCIRGVGGGNIREENGTYSDIKKTMSLEKAERERKP